METLKLQVSRKQGVYDFLGKQAGSLGSFLASQNLDLGKGPFLVSLRKDGDRVEGIEIRRRNKRKTTGMRVIEAAV